MNASAAQLNRRLPVVDDSPAIHDDFRKVLAGVKEDEDEFAALAFAAERSCHRIERV